MKNKIRLIAAIALAAAAVRQLSAAVIENVKFDPATGDNVINIYPEVLPPGGTDNYTYRVWFSSGNELSQNMWVALPETTQTTVRHYIGNRLGDFRYCAQHKYGAGSWVPDNAWTGTNPSPASVAVSNYIHNVKRGSPTELEDEENQLGMGPSWYFKYQLQDDSYVTIRIFPASTTVTGFSLFGFPTAYSQTPIRTLVHEVPRSDEMVGSVWWNTDEWDCRDSSGNIVANGIYWISLDAYSNVWSQFDTSDKIRAGRRGNWYGSIPVDTLRVMKFATTPITDYIGTKTFLYKLSGAANVTLKIYKDAPTFSGIDTNPSSDTYGEAVPTDAAKLIKTLKYYRAAGNWEEQWDGSSADGKYLADGIYTYSMSAVNDYKRIATDMYGNDRPMFGNITIMRTSPPSNSGVASAGGAGNITIGTYAPARGARVTSSLSSIVVGLSADDLGISPSSSYIDVTAPDSSVLKGNIAVDGKLVVARFPALKQSGVYTVDMKIADPKNRNWWVEKYSFSVSAAPASFADSVYVYPNPAAHEANFAHPAVAASGKITIRNIAGDLIKEDALGAPPYNWRCDGAGNGLYFYTVEINGEKTTKPLIIAR